MRALVAGGTGRLGSLVARHLVDHEVAVRVLTRDPRRAEPLVALRVEVVEGDVRRPDTLTGAVADVDVVVSAVQGFAGPGRVSPKTVDRDGNLHLVSAARQAKAAMVLVSIVGAGPDSPMELFRYKYAAEQAVRASGLPWTIVRATAFVELWAEIVGRGLVFGRGENPINFVSVRDVADLVTEAVVDPTLRGATIEIGGPEDLTFNELAGVVRDMWGRPTRVRHVPRSVLRVLGPLHRQPRAGLAMDTSDLTFRPGPGRHIGATSVRQALAGHSAPA